MSNFIYRTQNDFNNINFEKRKNSQTRSSRFGARVKNSFDIVFGAENCARFSNVRSIYPIF